jgi:sn-glycerol 3-phosphate transport system substrate-binding protein
MFVNGESAMWINSSAYFGGFVADITDFEFTQVPMPIDGRPGRAAELDHRRRDALGPDGPRGCGIRLRRAVPGVPSDTEQQADWAQATGYVPITMAAAELMEERGFFADNPGTDVAITQLTLNAPTANSSGLRFGNFVQIRDVINEELEAVWAGNKSAEEAMDAAVERGNELLRRFEAAN